jgi:archaetidylinositol phosphate synthase
MRKTRKKEQLQSHRRIIDTLTGPAERRILRWLAVHLPVWVKPDMLTAIGFAGALIISASYILSRQWPGFLWLAVAGFGLNWFGDSLDGTLARVRGIERPRYGYFLDHSVDALNEMMIFFSLGISSYVRFEIAAIALVGYLLLTLYTSLSTYVAKEFKLSYAYLGPTEIRLIAIMASIWVYFDRSRFVQLPFGEFSFYELIAMGLIVLFFSAFLLSTAGQVIQLARVDRPQDKKPPKIIANKGIAPKTALVPEPRHEPQK